MRRNSKAISREAAVTVTVDAAAVHVAGHAFYAAANSVWLPRAARLLVGVAR